MDSSARNSDGYKPNVVPRSLHLIHRSNITNKEGVVMCMEQEMKVLDEVKGVAYIGFKVTDIKRSVPWYVANLGCQIRQQGDGLAILKMPWGPDIELHKANPNELVQRLPFGFYVKNIEKYHSLLKENGVEVSEIKDQGGCGLLFLMYDPDGIKIPVWGGYKGNGRSKPDNWVE